MQSGDFSYEQIIDYAINIEQRGANLYTSAASKLKNEPTRNILLHLAQQEREHEAYFCGLKKDILISNYRIGKLDDEAVGYLSALVDNDIFPSNDKEFIEQFKTLKDVINSSKQAEKDSILFYMGLARFAWDENAVNVLNSIAGEEKKHLVQLQELDVLIEERDIYY